MGQFTIQNSTRLSKNYFESVQGVSVKINTNRLGDIFGIQELIHAFHIFSFDSNQHAYDWLAILFLRFDRNVGVGMFTHYLLEITNSIQARFQETEIWMWQIKRALLCMVRALITVGVHKRLEKYY